MKKFFKYLYYYLRYKDEINHLYGFSLKNGQATDEALNWFGRVAYWLRST